MKKPYHFKSFVPITYLRFGMFGMNAASCVNVSSVRPTFQRLKRNGVE
jgi:hypothetical protein